MNELELNPDLLLRAACRGSRRRMIQRQTSMAQVAPMATTDPKPDLPRHKVERRRQIDPTTCERDYSGDELEFMRAMDDYKRSAGRQFPTWSEVLEVVRSLGYQRPSARTQ